MIERQLSLPAEADTLALGAVLAHWLEQGETLHLHGDLGAGKTTLVRGLLRALDYEGPVKSPTYTLVESYPLAGKTIHHFDLYRITDPEELEFLGLDEYFRPDSIALIEWPERGQGVLPPPVARLELSRQGNGRLARLQLDEKRTNALDFLLKSTQY